MTFFLKSTGRIASVHCHILLLFTPSLFLSLPFKFFNVIWLYIPKALDVQTSVCSLRC